MGNPRSTMSNLLLCCACNCAKHPDEFCSAQRKSGRPNHTCKACSAIEDAEEPLMPPSKVNCGKYKRCFDCREMIFVEVPWPFHRAMCPNEINATTTPQASLRQCPHCDVFFPTEFAHDHHLMCYFRPIPADIAEMVRALGSRKKLTDPKIGQSRWRPMAYVNEVLNENQIAKGPQRKDALIEAAKRRLVRMRLDPAKKGQGEFELMVTPMGVWHARFSRPRRPDSPHRHDRRSDRDRDRRRDRSRSRGRSYSRDRTHRSHRPEGAAGADASWAGSQHHPAIPEPTTFAPPQLGIAPHSPPVPPMQQPFLDHSANTLAPVASPYAVTMPEALQQPPSLRPPPYSVAMLMSAIQSLGRFPAVDQVHATWAAHGDAADAGKRDETLARATAMCLVWVTADGGGNAVVDVTPTGVSLLQE